MADDYRRAEHLLYSFPVNIMRINEARISLRELRRETDCHAQNYGEAHAPPGNHSDPVAAYNLRIDALERVISGLLADTEPVRRVREFLVLSRDKRDNEMYCVMELYYFERMKMDDVALHLGKSISTLARRRQELIGLVIYEVEHC